MKRNSNKTMMCQLNPLHQTSAMILLAPIHVQGGKAHEGFHHRCCPVVPRVPHSICEVWVPKIETDPFLGRRLHALYSLPQLRSSNRSHRNMEMRLRLYVAFPS